MIFSTCDGIRNVSHNNKFCSLQPVVVEEGTAIGGRKLPSKSSNYLNLVGSYGNSLTSKNDGSFDQDYLGGVLVDELDNDHITLVGNAWKAFRLENSYTVTKNTRVMFDFMMYREAQGHAICFENDLNEDTFGGTHIRCLMLAGKQFSKWENVKKLNLAETQKGVATQKDTVQGCDAHRAIDGDLRQKYNGISSLNPVAVTNKSLEPWWQFEFDGNIGGDEFEISEVIIYAGKDFPNGENNLINFRVTICGTSSNSPSSSPTDTPTTALSDTPSESPTITPISTIDSCAGTGYSKVGEDIKYGGTVVLDGIISIPVHDRLGNIVRITLEGDKARALGLAEVKIIGTLEEETWKPIDISIFELLPTQNSTIEYIAFVQDDDEFPSQGTSPLNLGAAMSE